VVVVVGLAVLVVVVVGVTSVAYPSNEQSNNTISAIPAKLQSNVVVVVVVGDAVVDVVVVVGNVVVDVVVGSGNTCATTASI
jgi:hypothetical protein